MSDTDTYTVRLNTRVHAIANLLIKRHPDALSHSWFYQEGVMAAYDKAIQNGEYIPDDPFGELIEINNKEISKIQAVTDRLISLQNKNREKASRSLAGIRNSKKNEVQKTASTKIWDGRETPVNVLEASE